MSCSGKKFDNLDGAFGGPSTIIRLVGDKDRTRSRKPGPFIRSRPNPRPFKLILMGSSKLILTNKGRSSTNPPPHGKITKISFFWFDYNSIYVAVQNRCINHASLTAPLWSKYKSYNYTAGFTRTTMLILTVVMCFAVHTKWPNCYIWPLNIPVRDYLSRIILYKQQWPFYKINIWIVILNVKNEIFDERPT